MPSSKFFPVFLSVALVLYGNQSFAEPTAAVPVKAPFQTDAGAPDGGGAKYMDLYDTERSSDAVPMDQPHRTSEQIASWVENNITTAMNIDPSQWDSQLKKIAPEFDTYGLTEYQAYLKSSGIFDALQSNGLKLNSIASAPPVLLSEGALSGSYHWLYQLPMMLTYYDQDVKSLSKGQTKPQNRAVTIRVQIGRVTGGTDDTHVVIERWSAINP